ncbi:MAG: PD40 domain-containing protein, partial [Acidobacteria bacterium]|nr:PD40 domain-containing protein [Acidobacteriota bacterium]
MFQQRTLSALGVLVLLVSGSTAFAIDTSDTRMLAEPAVSANHLAFTYGGDLWLARRDGGEARRLTSHPGRELQPRFSPDGKTVAFSASYDGNMDVFVVGVEGGIPRRLTWHPGPDLVQDFTPDGSEVLFTSPRSVHTRRHTQLFAVGLDGGLPREIPLPHADKASISPDGKKIAYTPLAEAFRQWKNYRGGATSRIWIYDVGDHSVVQVPQPEGRSNDTDPMWVGTDLYFLSDRDGEFNLFSYDPATSAIERRTGHEDFPILGASAGGGEIVYEQGGYLHAFDPASGTSSRLHVGVAADLAELRPRYVKGAEFLRSFGLSPSGARAVVEYRGEILTLPAENGDPRNLTSSPSAHDRSPVWSPQGDRIAYFSDASGEYQLYVVAQDGRGEPKVFHLDGAGFFYEARWSPDGRKLSLVDNSWTLYVLDLESGKQTKISSEPIYGVERTLAHAWSPDSRWLAYTRISRTYFQQIHLYDFETGTSRPLTDGLSDAGEPVFDAGGKYLYFAASTDAGPVRQWFAQSNQDMTWSRSLYLAVLPAGEVSPFAKESDEEVPEGEDASEAAEKKGSGEKKEVVVEVDFDGIDERIVALPLPPGGYAGLTAGEAGKLFFVERPIQTVARSAFRDTPPTGALKRFDLEEREAVTLAEGVLAFALSHDGKKVLAQTAGGLQAGSSAAPLEAGKGMLAVDAIEVKIDPPAEWRQIFYEAWRINRDYFYDPGMHGADWPAMREKYARFLPDLASRDDLNRLLQWMCSELSVGHHFVFGGDHPGRPDMVPGGLLGADYEIDQGRYRFAKVLGGLNWNPELRSPLTEPGVEVQAGEYLLAVNGIDLRPPENVYRRFENTAGKIVEITVGPGPDGKGSRTVQVVPVEGEGPLRNRDWVEGNLRRVHEATEGRVAYVHVPDTATLGHTYFKRYFFPQVDKEAIIVDERYNGGGQIADYYIDILKRPYLASWTTRYGAHLHSPISSIRGPKVMLIDETAGSGGDLLPWMFHKFEIGTLIGRRTWGGLVGILGFPVLMDGGAITAPNIAFWNEEEGYGVENVGVPPDIEVEQLPAEI